MKKLLGLGLAVAMFASQAQAAFIWDVTGADMAGIEVTATYSDQTPSQTLTWEDLGGDAGGVSGVDWSLMVDGDTMMNDGSSLVGAWILSNSNQALVSLFINLGSAFVFDTLEGFGPNNGSGPGRDFIAFPAIGWSFSGQFQDELYTGLTLNDIGFGQTMFTMDTDAVVPAPAALSLMGLALLGLAVRSRRKQA
ncbi:PEP-CTERM sorting domain-containing protein [Paraglaciecola hydrolytica]|uniref:Ice-binding protein C-terminal domain-containing protein n=1 Tax=Paraglaciecola hydrolytica TaxID=1799789 RepID=A0A148KLS8_9ALTE|nr:PEP-CTERM sorting domain-containing protein [Paraglaciecola hydrolytica]KXI27240.1 hypothetical protein AX660_21135 [Paraglaciecola hydrolytica]